MKQSRYYPLLAVGCLSIVSCDMMSSLNQPISGGSYDPLDPPGSPSSQSDAEPVGPVYTPGEWLETTVPSAAVYARVPRANDQPYKSLAQGTPLKVISTEGTYVRVELESGDIGYVPSIMVGQKPLVPEIPSVPGIPDVPGAPGLDPYSGLAPEPEVPPISVENADGLPTDTIDPGDRVID